MLCVEFLKPMGRHSLVKPSATSSVPAGRGRGFHAFVPLPWKVKMLERSPEICRFDTRDGDRSDNHHLNAEQRNKTKEQKNRKE